MRRFADRLTETEQRALLSAGSSNSAIYRMVARALKRRGVRGECIVDVGCGSGKLYPYLDPRFERYIGVDVIRYEGFPKEGEFYQVDLDTGAIPISDGIADVVASVETIEHLENPRDFVRTLARLAKASGWVIVTTPNQLTMLSLLTLILKRRFAAFQDVHYPAHLSALLEIDLKRIAAECGLKDIEIEYSLSGRIPLTARHYTHLMSKTFPRALSDNLMLIGKR